VNSEHITFDNVSRFYGEVLGVNRVTLSIPPGITSLVGPNGSGKTTLLNLMSGLIHPTEGTIHVLGIEPRDPRKMFRVVGYSTQFDSFPRGTTGRQFIYSFLRLFGYPSARASSLTAEALDTVHLTDAADRKIAGYSKGMRQRVKLAQAIAHDPQVLVLDEPLNGLDPLVRAETLNLFRKFASQGRHVFVSTHILHEVDMISDQFILMSNGYVVAEGQIQDVRSEIRDHPMQVTIRCKQPHALASKVFEMDHVVEVRLHPDGKGVLVLTRAADVFYRKLNHIAMGDFGIESIAPADDTVKSVYEYLIGEESQR
jgi:ABC-2 type transport system ATP-binding protein